MITDYIIDQDNERNETLLLLDIGRQMSTIFDRRVDSLNLTRVQWKLLNVLRRNEGIRQVHLAALMEMEPITLVRQLDRMQAEGWVERRSDPEDRRANKVYLTPKIAGMIGDIAEIAVAIRREALADFSEEEHRAFIAYLTRMKQKSAALLAAEQEAMREVM